MHLVYLVVGVFVGLFIGLYIDDDIIVAREQEIKVLKKNSVSEGTECVEGVLYTTYGFKDLVVYEPQYISCN